MFNLCTEQGSRFCDGLTRRELLRLGSVGLGGLTLPGLLRLERAASDQSVSTAKAGKAKSVIILFLSGGPAHMDMWDLKPDAPAEIRGTFKPISTNVPGIQITEHMPRMAGIMDKCAIIRSMHHGDGGHPTAAYWMLVGSPMARTQNTFLLSREDRPHPGSAIAALKGGPKALPAFVMIPETMENQPAGPSRPGQHAGFLGPAYDPYLVHSDPNEANYNPGVLVRHPQVSEQRVGLRRMLLESINQQARHLDRTNEALDPYYVKAFDIISSTEAQRALDVSREPAKNRDRYGRHTFGQSTLVARRLIEAGVRLVHVNWVRHDFAKGGQGYDSHANHLQWAKDDLLPPTDAAFTSLIEDLSASGLLDETLVVMMGEFGRTPKFNKDGGRDHWNQCFSLVLAGGGIRGAQVLGASDATAAFPAADAVTPADLTATMYQCLGLSPQTEIHDTLDRPHVLSEGQPIVRLL